VEPGTIWQGVEKQTQIKTIRREQRPKKKKGDDGNKKTPERELKKRTEQGAKKGFGGGKKEVWCTTNFAAATTYRRLPGPGNVVVGSKKSLSLGRVLTKRAKGTSNKLRNHS